MPESSRFNLSTSSKTSTARTERNGKPAERAQLHDADVVTIGQHRLVFQDSPSSPAETAAVPDDLDETIAMSGQQLNAMPAKIVVTPGKTDRLEYQLTKTANLIGSQEGAAIRLSGWLSPKVAALISARGSACGSVLHKARNGWR